jgi:hypothetical protein
MSERRIGFADRYLVTIPDAETLAARRAADPRRRRRHFDLHARLGKPLGEWYSALEDVRPGSVEWGFDAQALRKPPELRDRYSVADLSALLARLPTVQASRDP